MVTMGIHLTDRDQRLLQDCYENAQLSFAQVQGRHFQGIGRATIQNRITKLRKAGLIRSTRVGATIHQGKQKTIGVVYQITRAGLAVLQSHHPDENIRDSPLQLNTTSLPHDLALTEVIDRLKGYFPAHRIVHGRVHFGAPPGRSRMPDAVAMNQGGKPEIAIELEYTAKSEKRYRQIITQYRLTPQYTKVIYVCSSNAIAGKIRGTITGIRRPLNNAPQVTSKFYFVTLADLLQGENNAPLSNGAESLHAHPRPLKIVKGVAA